MEKKMALSDVLVSYSLEAQYREVLKDTLPDGASLKFLPDIAETGRVDAITGARALITWNLAKEFSAEELRLFNHLGLIQLVTAGADHLPFGTLPEKALVASNPGAYAEPMAEHILGMALALAKRLCVNNRKLAEGIFDQNTKNRMLRGLACGVLGFGGIGQTTARLMRALGLSILAVNSSGKTSEPVDFVGTLDDLDHVLKSSDILLISIPLSKRTKNLIGARELALMKPDAMLINAARGAIVDETALYRHLSENPDFQAAVDTWWIEPAMNGEFKVHYPFFELPNFLGSPHNSPVVPDIMRNAVRMAGENVARFLRGDRIHGRIRCEDYIRDGE